MPHQSRSRLTAVAGAALVTALALAGCGSDEGGSDVGGSTITENLGTDGPDAPSPTDTTSDAPDATGTPATTGTIGGEPTSAAAQALSNELSDVLQAIRADRGEVGVDLLQIYPDYVGLLYVDQAEPDRRHKSDYRDSSWSEPLGSRRLSTDAPLPLDAIDPEILRAAIEATPGLLELDESRLSHISIAPDDDGRAEYLVTLIVGDSMGRVTFGPDGQPRGIRPAL